MKRYLKIAVLGALVLIFAGAGLAKLLAASSFTEQFARFGLPAWWVYLTGLVELTCALLIALPRLGLRRLGALSLAATMAVATMMHLLHDPMMLALPAAALMLLAGYVALKPKASPAPQLLTATQNNLSP